MLVLVLSVAVIHDSYGQFNRRRIKKNNKKMRNFKGKKNTFTKSKRYHSVGITLNSFHYFGDLSPTPSSFSTDIKSTKPGIGLVWEHRFGPRYTLRGSYTYGTIAANDFNAGTDGDNIYRYARNLQFRNRIHELSVVGVIDLFKNGGSYISRVPFTPYVFAGIAIFKHNPQGKVSDNGDNPNFATLPNAGEWVNLEPLGTEGQYSTLDPDDANNGISPYKTIQIAIPFGVGARVKLNQVMDLSLEFSPRWTFTDYLDDVSQNYVGADKLGSDLARAMANRSVDNTNAMSGEARDNATLDARLGAPVVIDGYLTRPGHGHELSGNIRGNKNNNDIYFVTTLRFTYILGGSFRRAKYR